MCSSKDEDFEKLSTVDHISLATKAGITITIAFLILLICISNLNERLQGCSH